MIPRFLSALLLISVTTTAAADDAALAKNLSATYSAWRQSVIGKSANQWQNLTAKHRQVEVRNRLVSEKLPFPAAVFQLPAPPPSLDGLKCLYVSSKGPTAKAAFYGKIDFGVGSTPADNILLLSCVAEDGRWKYDSADFVNLAALPEVRAEIAKGDLGYIKEGPDFQATGRIPPTPPQVAPAKYIAKVYAFCPGREVKVQVNRFSHHRFANAKEAEIINGGAKDGRNDVAFRVAPLEGGTGKEAFAVRVYLMSEIPGTKPIIAYEYVVEEGGEVKGLETASFNLDPETAKKLLR